MSDENAVKKKGNGLKKILMFCIIVMIFLIAAFVLYNLGYLDFLDDFGNSGGSGGGTYVLKNPLEQIIIANTENNQLNVEKAVEQGTLEFDASYIDYMLAFLGVGSLHKSMLGESPWIEIILDGESWNSEIVKGSSKTSKGSIENEDIRIISTKEDIVRIMLAENKEDEIANAANEGRLGMEIVAGETELFAKGYLNIYEKFKK